MEAEDLLGRLAEISAAPGPVFLYQYPDEIEDGLPPADAAWMAIGNSHTSDQLRRASSARNTCPSSVAIHALPSVKSTTGTRS